MAEHSAAHDPQRQLQLLHLVYRQRNLVERFFNRIRQFRGLATRYDRRPENYLAALKLAATRIWLAAI